MATANHDDILADVANRHDFVQHMRTTPAGRAILDDIIDTTRRMDAAQLFAAEVEAAAEAICWAAEAESLLDVRMDMRAQYLREARAALDAAREVGEANAALGLVSPQPSEAPEIPMFAGMLDALAALTIRPEVRPHGTVTDAEVDNQLFVELSGSVALIDGVKVDVAYWGACHDAENDEAEARLYVENGVCGCCGVDYSITEEA